LATLAASVERRGYTLKKGGRTQLVPGGKKGPAESNPLACPVSYQSSILNTKRLCNPIVSIAMPSTILGL
jgi:hypothetical protein